MLIDWSVVPPVAKFTRTTTGKYLEDYESIYKYESIPLKSPEEELAILDEFSDQMRKAGIKVVIRAVDSESTGGGKVLNEDVAELANRYPDVVIGMAGVDPNKGMSAVRELEYSIRELGLRGLNVQLFENNLHANDKKMYPLYAKCIELGVPVNLHTSMNFATQASMDFGRPIYLDEVMVDFPELKVVACPPGFPWVEELIAVAWRHPNVYIGLVAVRPKYLKKPHSGYEPLLEYGKSLLKDKIVVGSSFPLLPIERNMQEFRELSLPEDTINKWLGDNAAKLLNLKD